MNNIIIPTYEPSNDEYEQTIIVYDNYEINLHKYPRINTDKEKTDIIIVIFLMHEDFLKKLAESYYEANKYYNECKEYYYVFKFNKIIKKYSSQEIMSIINNINNFLVSNNNIQNQITYLLKIPLIDVIFYFYIRNKDFYLNLFENIEHSKKAYFERREYSYRIIPPNDFYNKLQPITYNAIELMEINSYAQYLIQRKIIKELPIPKYLLNK
jgi:hypothetical protein